MSRRPLSASFLVSILSASLLSACASTSGGRGAAIMDQTAIDALYARLDEAGERHRGGMEMLAVGDTEAGWAAMRSASAELLQAASECAVASGCDTQRFFAAYDRLLARGAEEARWDSGAFVSEGEVSPGEGEASPVVTHLPQAGQSINLLNGRELRDIIALNGPVKAALNEWLTWMRPQLVDAWENYQYMRHLMWPEYEQAGLPEALLFGILAKESGGRVHAVSRAGAAGPLQFMPATGLRYGLGRVDGFDTRFDPALSTRANVRYLNDRFRELNHNLELALAAYNGGEGRVGRLYRNNGGKSFWNARVYAQLPPETRDYVPMVLAAAWLFLHPADYGLEFPVAETESSTLRLARAASMNELAICIGNAGSRDGWFRVLRNLNPRYEAHVPIAAGTELRVPAKLLPAYQANCLAGARAAVAAELAAARKPTVSAAPASSGGSYTVRSGDTLASIARRHHCSSPTALAQANGIRPPNYLIRPGQQLSLSGCRG
jgi:membrane-bound lytic murein transglycosylase D